MPPIVTIPVSVRRPKGVFAAWAGRANAPPMMPSSDNGIRMRTIVDLPAAERAQLDVLCRQRGLSRAEAMRQALRQQWDAP